MVSDVSIPTTVLCLVRYRSCVWLTFVSVSVSVTISDRFVYQFLHQSCASICFQ
ncbi:hypothetical protein Hanom_Chr11g01062141 [Helianthus anomalus]